MGGHAGPWEADHGHKGRQAERQRAPSLLLKPCLAAPCPFLPCPALAPHLLALPCAASHLPVSSRCCSVVSWASGATTVSCCELKRSRVCSLLALSSHEPVRQETRGEIARCSNVAPHAATAPATDACSKGSVAHGAAQRARHGTPATAGLPAAPAPLAGSAHRSVELASRVTAGDEQASSFVQRPLPTCTSAASSSSRRQPKGAERRLRTWPAARRCSHPQNERRWSKSEPPFATDSSSSGLSTSRDQRLHASGAALCLRQAGERRGSADGAGRDGSRLQSAALLATPGGRLGVHC